MYQILMTFQGILLLAVASAAHCAQDDKAEPFLHRLILPKDKLPEGCNIRELPKDFVKGKDLKNPCVITDVETIRKLPIDDLRRLLDGVDVKAMLLCGYKEKNEIGVHAWRLDSDKAAEKLLETMKKRYPNPRRVRLWQTGPYVIWLWRDPGTTTECFEAFEMFLDKAVKEREKK